MKSPLLDSRSQH
jgi:hypothetical protein